MLSTFYVSSTGNDGNSGVDPATPLRTIQTAVNRAGVASGTHTINVAGGTYTTPGLDQTIVIPTNPNLTNLQLLGGWNTSFTVRDQIATPTIYIPQNSGIASSPDVSIAAPNVKVDGFSFTFDGTQGTGGARQSGGILVNANGVTLNSNFIEVGNSSAPGANDAYGIQTLQNANVTNLTLSNNTLTASANNVSSGIYLRPGTNNGSIIVIGNKIGGDNLMRGVIVDTISNVTVTSNIFDRNGPANAGNGQLIYAGPLTGNVDQSNITIVRNSLDNNHSGGATGISVNNAYGIEVGNGGGTAKLTNLHIAENYITDSEIGILVGRGVDASTTLIRGNHITANVTGLSRTPDAGQIINASGNWWNSASGPVVTSNPTGTGDSIFNISVEAVDYSPWLTTGDDDDAVTLGFQADFSLLTANATSPRSPAQGTSGNLQDGVNQTLTTGTLIALAGTYFESVTVNKDVTISPDGNAVGTVTVTGSSGPSTLNGSTLLVDLTNTPSSDLFSNADDTLTLTGATLKVSSTSTSTVGQVFTIVSSPGGIIGVFNGLAEGAVFAGENARFYQISYAGNVVTLTDIVDTTAPTASLTTAAPTINVATAATTSTIVTITYADAVSGVDTSSFKPSNITVTNGATTANVSTITVAGNSVTYVIDAPSGTWGASPQGTYTIALSGGTGAVKDLATNAVTANASFATFTVDTTPLTVSIDQSSGQADPTNASPINFRVVFNKPVTGFVTGDVTLGGTAGATTAIVTAVGGPGNTYDVTVSGMTSDGTVIPTIAASVASDAAGNPNTASTSNDNSVLFDTTAPTATLTTAAPTINVATAATTSTTVTITYADAVSGVDTSSFNTSNITVTNGATTANVSTITVAGNSVTYVIDAPSGTWGASPQGTYTIALSGGTTAGVRDLANNAVNANTSFTTFTVDTTPLTVSIDQSSGQADPTNASPINFRVVFNKPVTGFVTGDVTLGGTAGATTAVVTPVAGPGNTYDVTVSGMTADGTVIASINPGVAVDAAGNPNTASTSSDNSVLFDTTAPTATLTTAAPTINVAAATTTFTTVTITYSDALSGLAVSTLGSTNIAVTNGTTTANVTGVLVSGNAVTYTISAPSGTWGASPQGTYTIGLLGNVKDQAGNTVVPNAAFSSFVVDTTPLTVTIDQASGQADPTNVSPINYRVVFNKPVTGFVTGDVTLGGTAGATTAIVTPFGSAGDIYDIRISGMTTDGTVIPTISASVASDAAGNPNTASTSSDNSVLFDTTAPTATLTTPAPTINVATATTTSTTVTITYADSGSGLDVSTLALTNITVTNGATTATVTGVLVSGNDVTYTIAAPGGTWGTSAQGTYTIGLLGSVRDLAGNSVTANATFSSYLVDTTSLTVTIDRGSGQADPTNASPISFRVVFNKPVTGFTTGDISLGGSAGATTAVVTPVAGPGNTYDVTVSGMTTDGTVIASINPGVAVDAAGNSNTASTSTDNSVLFDTTAPAATLTTPAPTINVASATTTSTTVSITYDDAGAGIDVNTFATTNITVANGATTANVTSFSAVGNTVTYTINAPGGTWGASTQGTYTIGLLNNVKDQAGNTVAANAAFSSFLVDTTLLTVTINQASGQADPTNASPINFRVVFNKPVTGFVTGDVTLGGTSGATTAIVTAVGVPGTTYDVTVSGMTGDGTVIPTIAASVATDSAGNPNTASTSSDNSVLYDTTAPTATLTTAVPTINVATAATSATTVTITYSDALSGLAVSTLGSTNIAVTNGTTTANVTGVSVSGNAVTYTISAPGGTWGTSTQGTYTIGLLGNVKDQAGNTVVPNAAFSSFVVDTTPLTVTIDQASGQADPTNASPINFRVVFNKPVTGFVTGDVTLGGTAGATTAIVTAVGGPGNTYDVTVSGMTGDGTVIPTIAASVASDAAGNPNTASTSNDNSVLFDKTVPTATLTTAAPTINVATAPTTSTTVTITYADAVSGVDTSSFKPSNITVTNGATTANVSTITVTGNSVTYVIDAPSGTWGASPQGTYTIALSGGTTAGVRDLANNAVTANASFSTFTVDTTPLTVSIDQSSGQADPTNASPINFRVVFNKPVTGFVTGDVTLGGTAGATTAIVTAVGVPGTTYDVTVSGMTGDGTVIPTIAASVATDSAGNPNTASTSTDNSVLYDTTVPIATLTTPVPTIDSAAAATTSTTVTITYDDPDFVSGLGSGVDQTTFGTSNISVRNGSTIATVTGFSVVGNDVTYTIAAPGGTWGKSTQGTYTISLVGGVGGVRDVTNNIIAANPSFATFLVDTPTVTLSVAPPTFSEAGGTTTVTITLSAPSTQDVTVDLAFGGTASNLIDYTRTGSRIVITAGSTTGTVTLTAVPNTLDEPDKTIVVDIASVTNARESGTQQVTATIVDDDAPPVTASLSISDVSIIEGSSGTSIVSFTVSLSVPSGETVTVNASTADGTATAPNDYASVSSLPLIFAPGEITKFVSVTINSDTLDDGDLNFVVNLSGSTNATIADAQGVGTIVDDDATMFRVYNPNADLHVFTTSRQEFEDLVAMGYRDESSSVSGFRVSTVPLPGEMPIHRMYNPIGGHHYLTTSDGDRDNLLAHGWRVEPDQGYLYPSAAGGATLIYHLYNNNNGDHFYTANDLERVIVLSHPLFQTAWSQHANLGYSFTHSAATSPRQAIALDVTLQDNDPIYVEMSGATTTASVPTPPAVAISLPESREVDSPHVVQSQETDWPVAARSKQDAEQLTNEIAALDTVWKQFGSSINNLTAVVGG